MIELKVQKQSFDWEPGINESRVHHTSLHLKKKESKGGTNKDGK
jgi:hypothetical protein